jgi:trans-2,3-dihydro-3-hydroxyanthranilate isomerase
MTVEPVRSVWASVFAMRHCYVLRVFTRGEEGGNHLGVITDVTGLDDAGMQQIASENGYSETIFIDWREGGVPEARIFTPAVELPFAGHPLVGAAWVLGMMGPGTVDRIRCGIGEIPFHTAEDATWVEVPMATGVESVPDLEPIAAAVGLADLVSAWRVSMPLPYVVADAGSSGAVASAEPDHEALAACDAGMLYLVDGGGDEVRARFFAAAAGVPEDPATGSAACAYAAVRLHLGQREGDLLIHQGDGIGHPSTIRLRWDPRTVSLGGSVVRDEVTIIER